MNDFFAVAAAADDCTCASCVELDSYTTEARRGRCAKPVNAEWIREGDCLPVNPEFCEDDNTPPSAQIVSIQDGQEISLFEDILVEAELSGEGSDESRIAWYVDGEKEEGQTGRRFFIPAGGLNEDSHTIQLQVTGARGAASSVQEVGFDIVARDDAPPRVRIASPSDGATFFYNDIIPLLAAASDKETDNEIVEKSAIWSSTSLPGKKWWDKSPEIDPGTFACGIHTVEVEVEDSAGQKAYDKVTIQVVPAPTQRPKTSITINDEPIDDWDEVFQAGENEILVFDAIVNYTVPGIVAAAADWYLDGRLQAAACLSVEMDTSKMEKGPHVIQVQVLDSRGTTSEMASANLQVGQGSGPTPAACPTPTPSITASPTETNDATAPPTSDFDCRNDKTWFYMTEGGKEKECRWVKRNTDRCSLVGIDGRRAYEACPVACGNDPNWKVKVSPGNSRKCKWVARDPDDRCSLRGTDRRYAYEACAKACCPYNKNSGNRMLHGRDVQEEDEGDLGGGSSGI